MPRILLGVTGSVAAIKTKELVEEIYHQGQYSHPFLEVTIIATNAAKFFLQESWIQDFKILTDESDWASWKAKGDSITHIELRRHADIFVIAPLTANSLAKIANGLCDNLVTTVARAWDFQKPFLIYPAMNTLMWKHPITAEQCEKITHWGIKVCSPVEKRLACGDIGMGGMMEPQDIARNVLLQAPARHLI